MNDNVINTEEIYKYINNTFLDDDKKNIIRQSVHHCAENGTDYSKIISSVTFFYSSLLLSIIYLI